MIGAGQDLEAIQGFSDFEKINTFTRVYIYLFSLMQCFNLLSKGNKHIKNLKEKLDNGRKNLYEDFNLKNIQRHIRKQKNAAIQDKMKSLGMGNASAKMKSLLSGFSPKKIALQPKAEG